MSGRKMEVRKGRPDECNTQPGSSACRKKIKKKAPICARCKAIEYKSGHLYELR